MFSELEIRVRSSFKRTAYLKHMLNGKPGSGCHDAPGLLSAVTTGLSWRTQVQACVCVLWQVKHPHLVHKGENYVERLL